MIRIRQSTTRDIDRINAFYVSEGKSTRVDASERAVLAEDGETLIGVMRLCEEHGHLVLRTMRVCEEYQDQGIGTQMLQTFEVLLAGQECYCLPFSHLTAFYGRIGFLEIPVEQAPPYLQERYHQYRARGLDVVVMKRPTQL
jgi:N-acetylglutamate synthase-like GNAT family acetyltransferase